MSDDIIEQIINAVVVIVFLIFMHAENKRSQ